MTGVMDMCERYLLTQPPTMENLIIAQDCRFEKLLTHCCNGLGKIKKLQDILTDDLYAKCNDKTRVELFKCRLTLFESKWAYKHYRCKCKCSNSSWGHSAEDLLGKLDAVSNSS